MTALKIFGKKEISKAEVAQPLPMTAGSQIVKPHITEKVTNLAGQHMYVFVVQPRASKRDVALSVEKMYGVNVRGVHIINVHPKKMKLGRTKGMKKGYKKAIVRLREGQKIEILPT